MILTTREQLQKYSDRNPYFSAAFTALAELPFTRGRQSVSGDDVFIIGLEYDTHPTDGALMEAHRTYIDVMWMVSGQDAAGDAALGQVPAGCSMLRMEPGTVCILFPEDAHAPGLDVCGSSHVQKLIAKVRVV